MDVLNVGQSAHQQIGPAFAVAAQAVQFDGRASVHAGHVRQERQHAVPRLAMADHHAAADGLGLVGSTASIVGAEHGRPDASENLAGEDFFQHAPCLGPFSLTLSSVAVGLLGELLEAARPTVQTDFGACPIAFDAAGWNPLIAADQDRSVSGY